MDTTLARAGGLARFVYNDGYLLGPAQVVFPALDRFAKSVKDKYGLELQRDKAEVFTYGELPTETWCSNRRRQICPTFLPFVSSVSK